MDLQTIDERLQRIEDFLRVRKDILNLNEVAILTGLSKSTLYRMTCTGTIPHYKQAKHLYFDRDEIENWLKSKRIVTPDEAQCVVNN